MLFCFMIVKTIKRNVQQDIIELIVLTPEEIRLLKIIIPHNRFRALKFQRTPSCSRSRESCPPKWVPLANKHKFTMWIFSIRKFFFFNHISALMPLLEIILFWGWLSRWNEKLESNCWGLGNWFHFLLLHLTFNCWPFCKKHLFNQVTV